MTRTAWARTFGLVPGGTNVTAPGEAGLLKPNSTWAAGDEFLFTLDLAALPSASGGTTSLIADLNSHGFLDVLVDDETGVDFMKLTVQTDDAVPEPTTCSISIATLLMMSVSRVPQFQAMRRRKSVGCSRGGRNF